MSESSFRQPKRIVIDARSRGSTGRYANKLLEQLQNIDTENQYFVIVKSNQDWQPSAENFEAVVNDSGDYTLAEQLSLWMTIRKLRPDVVHFTMPQQPLLPLGRAKRVTTIHDLTMLRWHNVNGNALVYRFKLWVFRRLLKRVARRSDAVITPTKWVKLDIIRTLKADPIKIFITHESADKFSVPARPVTEYDDKRFILFNGNIFPHKNVEGLIDAFMLIIGKHADLHLLLAGKLSEYGQNLRQHTKHKHVHFLGFVPDENLRWLMENAEAYVYPSFSEGFGLPGLEAMRHKLPLVSSSATCLPEVYGPAAEYFDPSDIHDIARAIDSVLSDDARRKELVALGQAQLKLYSWRRMAEQTLAIYSEF